MITQEVAKKVIEAVQCAAREAYAADAVDNAADSAADAADAVYAAGAAAYAAAYEADKELKLFDVPGVKFLELIGE